MEAFRNNIKVWDKGWVVTKNNFSSHWVDLHKIIYCAVDQFTAQ